MTASIHGPDAIAASIVLGVSILVGEGIRRLYGPDTRDVIDEAIRCLTEDRRCRADLASQYPASTNWDAERDALDAIIAFLRTLHPDYQAAVASVTEEAQP